MKILGYGQANIEDIKRKYDYSVRLKESSKKNVLHKICDTFTEFLELIVANEQ